MLNHSASLAMSTSILKALFGKLDIKRHLPHNLHIQTSWICCSVYPPKVLLNSLATVLNSRLSCFSGTDATSVPSSIGSQVSGRTANSPVLKMAVSL